MKGKVFKNGLIFLLAALMPVSVIGCGKKTVTTSTSSTTQKATLTVMSWWDPTKPALQQLKGAFEASNPGIKLNMINTGSGYYSKVLTILASGSNIPDVMMLAADKLPMFASKGTLLPLDKYLTSEYKSNTYPMVQNACKFSGKTYAVARDVTSSVMYFNKKMFSDAGVEIPSEKWTIDDFLSVAKKMTKTDSSGKATQWGFYFTKYDDTIFDWLLLNGGDYADADGSKSQMSSAGTKAGLQFLQDLIYKYKVTPTDSQAKQFGDDDTSTVIAGKVAMIVGGLSTSVAFNTATPALSYAIRPLPLSTSGKQVCHSFVNTWTIPKGAKNPALSWKVIEYFSGQKGQQIALDNGMGLASNKNVDTGTFLSQNADNKYLIQSLTYATPYRTLVYGADFYSLVDKQLEPVWLNTTTVDKAVAAIEAKAPDILAGKSQQ